MDHAEEVAREEAQASPLELIGRFANPPTPNLDKLEALSKQWRADDDEGYQTDAAGTFEG